MSGLHKFVADPPNIAAPADDLLSRKSRTFAHPDEVVDDQQLTLADKRSLLASWASDALAVEDALVAPVGDGAVVCVDDVIAALKSLDLDELPHEGHEAAVTFFQSFPRRRSKPTVRRLKLRPDNDDWPPPRAARAMIPVGRGTFSCHCNIRSVQQRLGGGRYAVPSHHGQKGGEQRSDWRVG